MMVPNLQPSGFQGAYIHEILKNRYKQGYYKGYEKYHTKTHGYQAKTIIK